MIDQENCDAALSAIHTHFLAVGKSYGKDALRLQERYHQAFYNPLKQLRDKVLLRVLNKNKT